MSDIWLLTPAPAGRVNEVRRLHEVSAIPAERRVVVTTPPAPIMPGEVDAAVIYYEDDDFNISNWWNLGLDWIAEMADGDYEVMMAESDVVVSYQTLVLLATRLRQYDLSMVGADWHGALGSTPMHLNFDPTPVLHNFRLCGVAQMVAGEQGLRRDAQFRWYYSDDDAEWEARKLKGTGIVGGTTITHAGGTPIVGQLAQWCAEDGQKFIAKHGHRPLR